MKFFWALPFVAVAILLAACGGGSGTAPTESPVLSRPPAATTPGSQDVDATGRSETFPDSWNSIEGAAGPAESSFVAPDPETVAGRFQPPLELWTTTHDVYGDPRRDGLIHAGVDIGLMGKGGSELRAICSGTIAEVGADDSYGQFVRMDCGDGWSALLGFVGEVRTTVGVNAELSTIVALSDSTGSHTHLELRYNGVPVDPAVYLELPFEPVPTPLPTATLTVTATPRPGETATVTPTPAAAAPTSAQATNTPANTSTPQPTATATPTQGPQPTATRTPTRTPTVVRPPTATSTLPILR